MSDNTLNPMDSKTETEKNRTHTHVIHAVRIVKDFSTIGYWNGRGISSGEIIPFEMDDLKDQFNRAKEACIKKYAAGTEAQIVQVRTDIVDI